MKKDILIPIAKELLARLDDEARKQKRSRSAQLEIILEERYKKNTVHA